MTVRVSLLRPFYLGNDGDDGGPASACQGCTRVGGVVSIFNTDSKTRRFYYSFVVWFIEQSGILRHTLYFIGLNIIALYMLYDLCKYVVLV